MNVRVDPLLSDASRPMTGDSPVVLLGGWGMRESVLAPLAEALGVDAVLAPPVPGSSPAQRADAAGWLSRRLPPRAVLVGWSLGGSVAIEYAARFPARVAALVTIACNPCFCVRPDWDHGVSPELFAAFRAGLAEDAPAQLVRFAALQAVGDAQERRVLRSLRAGIAEADDTDGLRAGLEALAERDLRATLARTRVPTLHILGAEDRLVPASLKHVLPQLQPEASVWVASGAAHAPFLSRPEAVAARILDFLAVLDGDRARRSRRDVARSFSRAAHGYDASASLQASSADLLLELAPPRLQPARALDLGCGTGTRLARLRARFHEAQWHAADLSEGMLRVLCERRVAALPTAADAECLPFTSGCFDLVHSNLALQWSEEPAAVFAELARVLRPGGVALIGTLGPETLWELRAAWRAVDSAAHVHRFLPVARLKQAAEGAGLRVECCMVRTQVERHASVFDIARALKGVGAGNLDPGRPRGLTGRRRWERVAARYALLGDGQAGLPASWQLVQMVLVKPDA